MKVDPSDAQVERAGIPCKSRSQRRRVCGFVCLGRECLYRYSVVLYAVLVMYSDVVGRKVLTATHTNTCNAHKQKQPPNSPQQRVP